MHYMYILIQFPLLSYSIGINATFIFQAIVCCLIATMIAADDIKTKKRDPRGKRNLEHNLSHHHYHNPSFRSERRISLGPHLTRYPTFFPGRQLSYRKGRPQSLPPPPYAVQMEPLVQYSQRDPLYDPNLLHVPPVNQNDLTKTEDLASDHNHVSQNVYGPPKHVIERPIYIKEPEPIIEIIIKESNVTYPPIEVPATPAPKKKEQVQVFYVKYKKNPHGKGKDSIVYDKPVPAISPPIEDEEEHHHYEEYKQPEVITSPPPPSTTLRAIIKPESETYHAHKGIHITFGKEHAQEQLHDDVNEESAPEPAVSLPQGREFSERPPNHRGHENFGADVSRIPQPYRPFNQPPPTSSQFPQFGRKIITSQFPPPSRNAPPPFPSRHPPSNRNPAVSFSNFARSPHNQSPSGSISFRQPVPYQPFDQIKPQQKEVQFPRTHTHFPIRQQLPSSNSPTVFNQHHVQHNRPAEHQDFNQPIVPSQSPQIRPQQELRHQPILTQHNLQLVPNVQQHQQFHQQHQQIPNQHEFVRQQQHLQDEVRQHEQIKQQQFRLQQQQQKNQQQFAPQAPFVPPGGELIESVPKYEQHFSVGNNGQLQPQIPKQPLHVSEVPKQEHNRQFAASNGFRIHVQPESHQPSVPKKEESVVQIQPSQETEKLKSSPSFDEFRSSNAQAERQNLQLEQIQRQNQQIELLQRQKQEIEQIQRQKQQIELQRQQQIQQYQQQFNPNLFNQNHQQSPVYVNNNGSPSSTTPSPTTTTAKLPETTTKDPKALNLQLPDEVPDDLRQHLLSSGILNNADISVLDYDKVGDIPLSALPPDQLANFFNAGGAQQIASGSAPIPAVAKPDPTADLETEASENIEVKDKKPEVEMKVVHYDPETEEGRRIQDSYVKEDATQTDPVELSDSNYNRYLPLRLSGAQFPIPDIPELKGKKVNSVVVLAPVDYKFEEGSRVTREADAKFEGIKFPKGSPLKQLIDDPSRENFDKFLESESKTATDQQSVILLVTG